MFNKLYYVVTSQIETTIDQYQYDSIYFSKIIMFYTDFSQIYRFRRHHSTETTLINNYDILINNLDNN